MRVNKSACMFNIFVLKVYEKLSWKNVKNGQKKQIFGASQMSFTTNNVNLHVCTLHLTFKFS